MAKRFEPLAWMECQKAGKIGKAPTLVVSVEASINNQKELGL